MRGDGLDRQHHRQVLWSHGELVIQCWICIAPTLGEMLLAFQAPGGCQLLLPTRDVLPFPISACTLPVSAAACPALYLPKKYTLSF